MKIENIKPVDGEPGRWTAEVDGVVRRVACKSEYDVEATIREGDAPAPETYIDRRVAEYPGWREQMDMLFHDIVNAGAAASFPSFTGLIAAIKARHPKN